MDRRSFLQKMAGLPIGWMAAQALYGRSREFAQDEDLGVASGSPTAHSIVLWTRVPAHASIGQNIGELDVVYECSQQPNFAQIERRGVVTTSADVDFTVKAIVDGLAPFTMYYYRFHTETGYQSIVGETKTAPLNWDDADSVKFASVSCQDYTLGYYTVYEALLNEDLDFVIHLGDSIYERGNAIYQHGKVRLDTIGNGESRTLDEYRMKQHLYLSDPYYRELRRRKPFINLSDDHEVFNNWGGGSLDADGLARKRAGLRAFHEFMPTPFDPSQEEALAHVYRKIAYGPLLDLFVLDQRQFRDAKCPIYRPVCGGETRSMLGEPQLDWFQNSLGGSNARWKFLLSELVMMPLGLTLAHGLSRDMLNVFARPEEGFLPNIYVNKDGWDGYEVERRKITEFVAQEGIQNLVILSGDVHNFYAGALRRNPEDNKSPTVGVEFVTGSITSHGISDLVGHDMNSLLVPALKIGNPHLSFCDVTRHGYCYFNVTAERAEGRMMAVKTIKETSSSSYPLYTLTIPDAR